MSEQKGLILTEDELINKVFNELHSCDGDMLAAIAELMFGGKCFAIDDHYEFVPNENYFGAFGEVEYIMTDGAVLVFKGDLAALRKRLGNDFEHKDVIDFSKKMRYSLFVNRKN